MFLTIYTHEIKTWFKKPLFYIYAGALFILAMLISAIAVGVFDSDNVTVTSSIELNSAIGIYGMLNVFALLTYLLIPSIMGGTIQRDFENNMHNVLYKLNMDLYVKMQQFPTFHDPSHIGPDYIAKARRSGRQVSVKSDK